MMMDTAEIVSTVSLIQSPQGKLSRREGEMGFYTQSGGALQLQKVLEVTVVIKVKKLF